MRTGDGDGGRRYLERAWRQSLAWKDWLAWARAEAREGRHDPMDLAARAPRSGIRDGRRQAMARTIATLDGSHRSHSRARALRIKNRVRDAVGEDRARATRAARRLIKAGLAPFVTDAQGTRRYVSGIPPLVSKLISGIVDEKDQRTRARREAEELQRLRRERSARIEAARAAHEARRLEEEREDQEFEQVLDSLQAPTDPQVLAQVRERLRGEGFVLARDVEPLQETLAEVARAYGISQSTVARVVQSIRAEDERPGQAQEYFGIPGLTGSRDMVDAAAYGMEGLRAQRQRDRDVLIAQVQAVVARATPSQRLAIASRLHISARMALRLARDELTMTDRANLRTMSQRSLEAIAAPTTRSDEPVRDATEDEPREPTGPGNTQGILDRLRAELREGLTCEDLALTTGLPLDFIQRVNAGRETVADMDALPNMLARASGRPVRAFDLGSPFVSRGEARLIAEIRRRLAQEEGSTTTEVALALGLEVELVQRLARGVPTAQDRNALVFAARRMNDLREQTRPFLEAVYGAVNHVPFRIVDVAFVLGLDAGIVERLTQSQNPSFRDLSALLNVPRQRFVYLEASTRAGSWTPTMRIDGFDAVLMPPLRKAQEGEQAAPPRPGPTSPPNP